MINNMKKEMRKIRISGKEKKALSPAIATLLIIALVVVLIAIILLWARTWLGERLQKFNNPIENSCSQAIYEMNSLPDSGSVSITITNTGNVPIYSFELRGIYTDTEKVKTYQLNLGKTDSGRIDLDFGSDFSESSAPDRLVIYPVLAGTVAGKRINRPYTCLGEGKSVNLE